MCLVLTSFPADLRARTPESEPKADSVLEAITQEAGKMGQNMGNCTGMGELAEMMASLLALGGARRPACERAKEPSKPKSNRGNAFGSPQLPAAAPYRRFTSSFSASEDLFEIDLPITNAAEATGTILPILVSAVDT